MWDYVMKAGILIYPILTCSVVAIAIILERLYHFYMAGIKVDAFRSKITDLLKDGKISDAAKAAEEYPGPIARVAALILENNYFDKKSKEEAINRVGSKEIRRLEQNLRGLSIVFNVAPLLGLLGTVIGMVRAFIRIEELGGVIDVSILAGGIWEAMITPGAGLTVAIPAMIAYHLFEGKVDEIASDMKDIASELGELVGVEEIEGFVDESRMEVIREEDGYAI